MKFRNLIHKAFIATCIGLSVLAFSSCSSTYFQVVNLSYSDNVKISGNNLSSQNEDLEILYNFWGNGLFMRFDLINKTDKEIFILLPQSFYIKNDFAVLIARAERLQATQPPPWLLLQQQPLPPQPTTIKHLQIRNLPAYRLTHSSQ